MPDTHVTEAEYQLSTLKSKECSSLVQVKEAVIDTYQDDGVTNCVLQDISARNNAGAGLLNCCLRSFNCGEPMKTGID